MSILVVKMSAKLRELVDAWRISGFTIGVVPTMGALHAGHLSLVEFLRNRVDRLIVTIFVNPAQFAPSEDFARYPRTLDDDLRLLTDLPVDVVFTPNDSEIYPPGFSTHIDPPCISRILEGEFRPHHFRGVATVVLKLLNLCQADWACFGQKDYQQCCVVQHMLRDLNHPCQILVAPIVREHDGLALSSRNRYLSAAERQIATVLNRTLQDTETQIAEGERDGFVLANFMKQSLIDGGITQLDYATIADPNRLQAMDEVRLPCVLLIAAYVGRTRLIDNRVVVRP